MIILKCYPTITDFINEIFGTQISLPLYSFGFFVALGFFVGSFFLIKELKRRENLGIFEGFRKKVFVGKPASLYDIIFNLVLGFVLGYKLLGIAFDYALFSKDPQSFLFSAEGSLIGGIIGGLLLAGYIYISKNREKLDEPIEKEVVVYPAGMVGDIVIIAAVTGVLGSNVFYWFESPGNFSAFLQNPFESFFSGLTIYGGLTFGALGLLTYAWIKKIKIPHLFDALAPTYMMAYAVGRLGCQVSGDGDWGIANTFAKPGWIPQFLWADRYENNIGGRCCWTDHSACDCSWAETPYLVDAVFPTPIYETIMCTILFLVLWSLRKKLTQFPGMLFGIFLVLNGLERFLIEKIRVNTKLDFLGMQLTQAEIIAFGLMIFGTLLATAIYLFNKKKQTNISL